MGLLTVQTPPPAGAVLTLQIADPDGDEWAPTGMDVFVLDNAGVTPCTVTFLCHQPCDTAGLLHDSVQTVGPGERKGFPPCGTAFTNPETGHTHVIYSDVTDCTVAVFQGL
jgi:hypothetical protein